MSSRQQEDHVLIVFTTISLICQTLFYGVYAALIPFSTYFLLKKETMSGANKIMFGMTIFMFILSTAFWTTSVVNLIASLNVFYDSAQQNGSVAFLLFPLFNALLLINYVLTDSVVVWRAWVLCRHGSKMILSVAIFFLLCTAISVFATISIRIAITFANKRWDHAIDISQVANFVLSLITNMIATSVIAYRARLHHRSIRETLSRGHNSSTKVENILTLLVESGFIYCISGIIALIALVIRLPKGTLGDIYNPIHVQVAGIYPTVVLILVSQQRSLKEGVFSTTGNLPGTAVDQIGPMNFTTNPTVVRTTIFLDDISSDDTANTSVSEPTLGICDGHEKSSQ